MALILSIETSTTFCSVALHQGNLLVAKRESLTAQSTASQLAVLIDEMMKSTMRSPRDLNAVAVSAGPGSYTGLRIGVATAKGICYALSIPLISINTLELLVRQFLASQTIAQTALCCPMLDARRMEVYCLLANRQKEVVEKTQAKVIDADSFANRLATQEIYFFGDGAAKCKDAIQHPNAHFIDGLHPFAEHMGAWAFEKFQAKEIEDTALFEPFYLKDFLIRKPIAVN
ncbi:MAG: tRNA (adenosine(37)-N6)-threonylcarbamoyltransferase complex dimerization subunit type 1 TsaB [Bacteroidota bacterium]|jgi:tRNA threonylcarbamoyladenosine biosynthesis protein TsaB|nr:tRNA (adenosine(37)-N6)-threonylcarbamoyltransferase complex dimerization subunit type 1 TsaB [Flammeovirgaceae bacterium]MCZ8071000.1 tRNA (adenosine(37)-N6)-threonylcarbamoyltransferase complex dimerization subunit type 1 TsaB [Cytophagales bacterium]